MDRRNPEDREKNKEGNTLEEIGKEKGLAADYSFSATSPFIIYKIS